MDAETSNAELTIARVRTISNFECTKISISIRHGKELHQVTLSPEAFALAVQGCYQPATYDQTEVGRVSK